LQGSGNQIETFLVDGKPSKPEILGDGSGRHNIKIVLTQSKGNTLKINKIANYLRLKHRRFL
jgi:hypothetical protein